MTIKHISYPSIEQFRNVIQNVSKMATYAGKDEDGNAIHDPLRPKPTITFNYTVKGHGTNAGFCYNNTDGMWFQSRERIITPMSDNAGCAAYLTSIKAELKCLIDDIAEEYNIDMDTHTISVYGEWIGMSIQKGVGISNLPKMFILFGIKISDVNGEDFAYWVNCKRFCNHDVRIYNIYDFPNGTIDIDFEQPALSQNTIIDMTIAVEEQCPIAEYFGFSVDKLNATFFEYSKEGKLTCSNSYLLNNNAVVSPIKKKAEELFSIDPSNEHNIKFFIQILNKTQLQTTCYVWGSVSEALVIDLGNISLIGEGLVFDGVYKDSVLRFKSKGARHQNSKVKVLAPVDTEKLNSINEFVEYSVTKARFDQALEKIFGIGGEIDIKQIGEVIRWVHSDILKEEMDTIMENNLEPKDIGKQVANAVKKMFFEKYKTF